MVTYLCRSLLNFIILSSITVFFITGCGLNDSEKNIGPKLSVNSDDVDFNWDLWPELEENKTLQTQKLVGWPELKNESIIFLGDESLSANWGLMLEKSFLSKKNVEKNLNPWFLSTCMSARDFKNGKVSSCGFYSLPYKQDIITGLYITMDQTENSDRLAPKIISDEKVKVVVISFGHRISVMNDKTLIQQELSAIELMAKWAHSSGKKCYVIEPVDAYFVETEKNDFLSEEQKNRLRVSVQDYCEWIGAKKLRADFLTEGHVPVEDILNSNINNASEDYFYVPSPKLYIDSSLPDLNLEGIEIPKNNLDPEMQVLPRVKGIDQLLDEKRQNLNDPQNDHKEDEIVPDVVNSQEDTVQSEYEDGKDVENNDPSSGVSSSIRPKARPERVSRVAQELIRQQLETGVKGSDLSVIKKQEASVPKYLWNGHVNGQTLSEIGFKYLNNSVGSYLVTAKNLRDVKSFCPSYWNLSAESRQYFWLYLFSAVARYENQNFNPKALHKEKASGTHSIGIFQVDTKNCGYGSDSNKASLYDMDNNFKCALTKASSLVKAGKQVADGRYSGKRYTDYGMDGYWSVLRKPYVGAAMNKSTGQYQNVSLGRREKIMQLTNSIKICN
jgi:hypothetical protein